jgi:CubicO group peptidase (beta-lactamase class C family)
VVYPGKEWIRAASPEDAGWSSEALAEAWAIAEDIGSGAVMVVQGGVVVATWGDIARKYPVFSMRKQLLHALLGAEVAAGRLDLDATLAELDIDDRRGLTTAERRARVRDLLTSRSGVYHPAAYETRDARRQRPRRGSHQPGAHFYYNNWDFNALGTIYERSSGRDIFQSFRDDVARPLEMQDFSLDDTERRKESRSEHPAYLFELTARDAARFGLLYLRGGRWQEEQVVPREWIDESARSHVPGAIDERQDFGYLLWVYPGTPGLFGASGKGNQKILVWPERDLVVVHLAATKRWGLFGSEVGGQDFWRLFFAILRAAPDPEG